MPKVALFNQNGSTNGEIELNASVFGIEPNESVVFDAILMQRASLRQGTHKVKTRSEVRGGGRKPWALSLNARPTLRLAPKPYQRSHLPTDLATLQGPVIPL